MGDGEESGAGKTVGIAGGIFAAIAAAVAHGADDCARVGARVGAHGDDLARPAVGVVAGGSDDLGRGASRLGVPGAGVVDDTARGASPSEQLIESLAEEASMQAVDLMLQEDEAETPTPTLPHLAPALYPTVVSLVPASASDFRATFERAASPAEMGALQKIGPALTNARFKVERASAPQDAVTMSTTSDARLVLVLGYVTPEQPQELLANGGTVSIASVAQGCVRTRRRCAILACETVECAESTGKMLGRALAVLPKSETELLRHLLAERAQERETGLTIHRVVQTSQKLRLVHSKLE